MKKEKFDKSKLKDLSDSIIDLKTFLFLQVQSQNKFREILFYSFALIISPIIITALIILLLLENLFPFLKK